LRAIDPSNAAIAPAIAFLQATPATTTETLARALAVMGATPADLLALQNPDGGWGLAAGFSSEPWTTALALKALIATGNGSSSNATQAEGWLLGARLPDGGWAYTPGETSRVAVTADVVRALGSVPRNLDIQGVLNQALSFLQSKRRGDAGYGDEGSTPLETALAVRALAAAGADLGPIAAATLTYLTGVQRSDGSWERDPYVTALALQAVVLLQNPPVPPTTGGVTAQVLDNATGQPLAGVTARRYGEATSVLTDAFGRFTLDGLAAGPVTLEFSKTGYLTQTGMATVTVGVIAPLGTIRLLLAPTTASVTGRVTHATAGTALSGVTVAATDSAGRLTATTGGDGSYSISGLTPGPLTLTASKTGYQDASATGTAVAGVTIQFSPALPLAGQTPPTTASVQATVLDATSRAPIGGVTLVLGAGGTAVTDAAGHITLTDVPVGTYTGTLSATGYLGQTFTAVLSGGSTLDLGTILLTSLSTPGSLTGLVVDAASNQPLSGVAMALASNPTVNAASLSSGVVILTNLSPGTVGFTVTKDGYVGLTRTATIAAGTATDLGILRLTPARTTATVRGTVTDATTGAALAGVQVQITGATILSATTNASGSYEFPEVIAGDVTLTASKAGYAPAVATTTLAAGIVLTFSPALGTGTGEGGTLLGSVLDGDTGEPFAGATVQLLGGNLPSGTTSATGAFSLPLFVDRPSLFYIEATAPGYLGETRYIVVFPDAPTYLAPFILARPGAGKIAGRVVAAETEAPLADVTVTVLGGDASAVTDETGAFTLTGLDAGGLSLALSKSGYGTARVDTAVARIGTTDVGDLFLAPFGPPPGADLALFPEDLVVSPAVPQPGALVSVAAVVRNLGTTDAAGTLQLYAGNPNLGGTLLTSAPVTVGATFRQTINLPSVAYPADRPQLFVVVSGVEPSDVDPRNNIVTPGRPPAAVATSALDAVKWLMSHQIPISSTQGAWIDYSVAYLNSYALRAYQVMGHTTAPRYQPAMTKMLEAQGPDGNFAGVVGTGHVIFALLDTGMSPDSPRIQDAASYLRRVQNADGSWASGGRGFAGRADVTGTVLAALLRTGTPKTDSAVVRAVTWLKTTQNSDGYWGDQAGAASNPFVSTYAVVGLALATSTTDSAVTRAKTYYDGWRAYHQEFLRYWLLMMRTLNPADSQIPSTVNNLLSYQRPDGGWSLSGYNYTDFALTAEVVAIVRGLGFTDPRLTTGLSWITLHINADGESFPDNQWIPTTGWATTALETNTLTADGKASVIAKARTTLVATQQGDGSWPNPIPPAPAPFIEPSALSVMALSVPPPASWTSDEQSAVSRGVNFLRNAQKKSGGASLLGGWPDYYWDAHVTQGASINALLGLLQARYSASDPEVSRGLTWLAGQQLPDGSWANSRDTAFAALIFQRAGVYPERVQRAIAWLLSNQNPNGGWGTLLGQSSGSSYSALGVMALSGAGERGLPVARGICYVQSVQRADGSWGGPTGTGQILWALTGAQVNQQVTLSLALNKAVYYPGDTIQVTVTAQGISPDQLTLQGTVSPQEGEVAAIAFTREADRFVATYPVPGTAIPGTWAVSVIGTGPTGETGVACATLPVKNPVGNAPDLAVFPADIAFSAGAGGSVTIGAAVRNLQAIDASDVVVRFYDGDPNGSGTVLGQVTLPRIEGGGIGLATLSWVPTGTRDIYVKTDPDNGIAETEEGNNLALRSFVPQGGTAPPSLTLGLDRAEYPANSEVQIALAMGNPLGTAGDFAVNLTVESAATGAQIASLPALSVTALAPGEARALATAWNDGTTPAGLYAVRGTLRDGAGATITTRLEQFRIVAGDGGQVPGRQLSSTVTTDRQTYDANQTAAITGSVSNPTPNAAWYNLLVSLQVLNDSGATVWSSNQTVASLAPLATSNLRFGFAIGSASPGTYTAVLGVTDTASGVVVDSRSATFQVVSSAATGTGLTGTLTATPGSPFRNVSVQLDISVRNSGNAAVDLAGLQILLVDPRTQTVLHTLPLASGSLAIGGERSDWVTATGGSLPAQAAKTSYVAVLQATLPGGLTKTLTSAAITVVDRPPVLSDPGPQTVNEGQTLVVTMAATDPDGDPISLSVSPLPSNASFTPETGTLTFAPDFTQANDYSVTVTASDGIVTGTRTVLIRVANINRPPAFAPLVNLGVNESEIVNLAVLASDPDGAASLTIAVENLPPFAEFTDLGSGQATIRFAPGFSDAGSYPGITVTVADHDPGNPLSNTKTFDVTVQNANRPPVLDQIANQSLAEGATLDIPVAATDPDGNGTLRLTLESAPAFASLTDNGGGQGILHLTPGYSDAGAYPGITVRADDQDAVAPLQAVQTFIVTVGNTNRPPQVAPIPDQTVAEGATLDVPVTATDPDGSSSLTLSLAGAPAFVTLTDTGNGQGILHIAPGSGTAASYLNVTLTADDHDSALPLQGSATFTLTVTPAGPTTLKAKVKIEPDTLNLKSHGRWVTAYIELPAGYDVADIDVATVALTRVKGRELTHPILAVSHPVAIGDKDHDGIPDLMVKFDRGQVERVVPVSNHVLLTVEGRLHTGQAFKGSDRIRVIRGGDHDHDDDDCDDDEDGRHHDPEDDHDSQRGKDRDNRRH
jgi:squalene cyclase